VGIKGDLSLSDLIKLPGVLETADLSERPEALWPALEGGFKKSDRVTFKSKGFTFVAKFRGNFSIGKISYLKKTRI